MLSPSSASFSAPPAPAPLTPTLLAAQGRVWRAHSLGQATAAVVPSSFAALDAELPGGGWPLQAVTELLVPQAGVLEWRLLAPALRAWWAAQAIPNQASPARGRRAARAEPARRTLLLVNPPHTPHLPGLQGLGLDPGRQAQALVWVATATPAQALWTAEQAIKSRVAVLAWLPEARPEQLRRLQVHAQSSDAPAFLVRPEHAGQQPSAAPLRLAVRPGEDSGGWALDVHLLKRRGPAHEGWLKLQAVPGAVEPLLTAGWRLPAPAEISAPTPAVPAAPLHSPSPTERPHALARPVLPA